MANLIKVKKKLKDLILQGVGLQGNSLQDEKGFPHVRVVNQEIIQFKDKGFLINNQESYFSCVVPTKNGFQTTLYVFGLESTRKEIIDIFLSKKEKEKCFDKSTGVDFDSIFRGGEINYTSSEEEKYGLLSKFWKEEVFMDEIDDVVYTASYFE